MTESSSCGSSEIDQPCSICGRAVHQYCCPQCGIRYCSVDCYRSEAHALCSEKFYQDCVVEALSESPGHMTRTARLLLDDFHQRVADADDELLAAPADLEQRMAGIDLDKCSVEQIWQKLNEAERQSFNELLQAEDLSGLLKRWTPWWQVWLSENDRKVVELKRTNDAKKETFPLDRRHRLKWPITELLLSYVLLCRFHNGEHTSKGDRHVCLEFSESFQTLSSCFVGGHCEKTDMAPGVGRLVGEFALRAIDQLGVTETMIEQAVQDVLDILSFHISSRNNLLAFEDQLLTRCLDDMIAVLRRASRLQSDPGNRRSVVNLNRKKLEFFRDRCLEPSAVLYAEVVAGLELESSIRRAQVEDQSKADGERLKKVGNWSKSGKVVEL